MTALNKRDAEFVEYAEKAFSLFQVDLKRLCRIIRKLDNVVDIASDMHNRYGWIRMEKALSELRKEDL